MLKAKPTPQSDGSTVQHHYLDIFVENIRKKKSDPESKTTILLERWHISLEHYKVPILLAVSNVSAEQQLALAYKKAAASTRGLHSLVISLPSYKLYKRNLLHRQMSAGIKYLVSAVEPQSEASAFEEGSTSSFSFSPIALNSTTQIKLAVQYRKNINFDEVWIVLCCTNDILV